MNERISSEARLYSEEDCIRRIGELICKGILCSPALRDEADNRDSMPAIEDQPSNRIVEYLRVKQVASPAEMRAVLQLSRSTTYRALQRLLDEGRVSATGRTSAAAYRLQELDSQRN
jgi:predicted HTH transcriptional regulator